MSASRRLAAILVADVVGYSRLMEADEAGTLTALKERRESILNPVVRAHAGRIVKLMGDGALIEFASAVKAVEAALELQRKMAEANEPLPEDRRLMLRVGINLGDIVGEGSDVYGEGVNIAARLESIAEPGGLCISGKVHDEVRGKTGAEFLDVGERQLKNISTPVRAFVTGSGNTLSAAIPSPLPRGLSIAVLPFSNLSGDPAEQYFSDGFCEDISTELSRFRNLRVTARNSSFRYRSSDLDLIRVGRELGVSYLLAGSVRRLGSHVRITSQLIDASSGVSLWAEKFDRAQDETFDVQDQVVRTITATLFGRVQTAALNVAKRKPPASLSAYECVLRADALPIYGSSTLREARALYEQAIGLDPGYARAYALLAVNCTNVSQDTDDPTAIGKLLDAALMHAQRAVLLDENDSVCHNALSHVHLTRQSYVLAEHHCRRALELNPNRATHLASYGYLCWSLGRPEEAIEHFRKARQIDPHFEPTWYWPGLGAAYFLAGQYGDAVEAFARAPNHGIWPQCYLAAAHALAGAPENSRDSVAYILDQRPTFSTGRFVEREPLKRAEDRERLLEGMHKAGLPR